MGLFNSSFLLSEDDLNAMEFTFLLRSTFQRAAHDDQFLTVNSEEEEEEDDDDCDIGRKREAAQEPTAVEEEEKDGSKSPGRLSSSSSSSSDEWKVEDDDNGFKTPTSLEHKIPAILRCPLAPRKPKSRPVRKRKASERQRLLLDLSSEIQSLFPADFLVGLGGKIKRVRQERN